MRKALATFGSGPAAELLDLALPTFSDYAARHDYEIVVGDGDGHGRPPSWGKIPFLRNVLNSYDFVVWIDADALILDTSVDLESIVPSDAYQAFAITTLPPGAGTSPNCGVWVLRAGPRAQRFLAEVWKQDDLVTHQWWEQAAVMRLTGWTIGVPVHKQRSTEWDIGTFVLDEEWDMIPKFPIGYANGKIRHYADWGNRRRKFDMRTDLALAGGFRLRYWFGQLERLCRPVYWPITGELRHLAALCLARARRIRRAA